MIYSLSIPNQWLILGTWSIKESASICHFRVINTHWIENQVHLAFKIWLGRVCFIYLLFFSFSFLSVKSTPKRANPKQSYIGCINIQELGPLSNDFFSVPFGPCDQIFLQSNFSRAELDVSEHHHATFEWISKWNYEHDSEVRSHSWEKGQGSGNHLLFPSERKKSDP